mmetsp:Transcript_2741/g.8057  ORF Transcript_2741/g.8057 Transcript_2741/m.8057 type:complete len:344 (-) Transcript_2741:188-1219(-)|eukprot:CAMPEP_0181058456 /NCGR_PEP_ID=MMETSP1070-20121207/20830_1 /TAXON_ID=265543 /ORGANISM="Minutocellus polymorphus, Strain NH13" /LENGTH=343 /DNA_ID=CAMNT_0023138011 /DNA_START=229 /DNA_END=1260 /DNA_ORIENTATION=-
MSDNEEEVIAAGDADAVASSDPTSKERQEFIEKSKADAKSELELALYAELESKDKQIARLTKEILKLQGFVSKRKQQYKRKRKDDNAPTRALSAYNIFVKERFSRLAAQNEAALKSTDASTTLERIPPSSLVASSGLAWKDLSAEERVYYEDKAKTDRTRYQQEMANYHPPEKTHQRKRNKTGYNMFFSAHVTEMKRTEEGVPSERGSVARLVGNAWKNLSSDEKEYYEKLAEAENGNNPIAREEEEVGQAFMGDEEGMEGSAKRAKSDAAAVAAAAAAAAASVAQPAAAAAASAVDYGADYYHGYYQGNFSGYDYSQYGYYDNRYYQNGNYQYPEGQYEQQK